MKIHAAPGDRAEAVRAFVRRIINERFDGNARAFATEVGLPQSAVSYVLAGKGSLGVVGLEKLADYCRCSVDEVLGRAPVDASHLRSHPQWAIAAEAARAAHPEISLEFFDAAGGLSIPGGLPPRLDAVFVAGLASEIRGLSERAKASIDAPRPTLGTALPQSGMITSVQPTTPDNVRSIRKR